MEKVYIFGHKNPDTDSVCGAISLSYLKKQMGINAEACILSEINPETRYVLNRFKVDVPKYLNDVKLQLKDVKFKKGYYLNEKTSIFSTYNYIADKGITGIPLTDDDKKFAGYVSLKEIASELICNSSNELCTSFDSIAETLDATKVYKYDEEICGLVMAVTLPYRIFIDTIPLSDKDILIVGNREHIVDYAIKSGVKLLIIINNRSLTEREYKMAEANKVNIIITPYDSFKTARLINLANPIRSIKSQTSAVCFETRDYLTDFLEISNKVKHTNYPIVNSKGNCDGMLRVIDTGEVTKKKVILVDHNEPMQSVDGIDEADILEVVDHHNIGDINTSVPINVRCMAVGSVNTIIYFLYEEQAVKIPKHIASLMLSGILSDTLLLKSPTTTNIDREVATKLAKMARLDINVYGLEMLRSGLSIEGLTPYDVINKDVKNYVINDYRFSISQVFTADFKNDYLKNIDNYVDSINDIARNYNYKVACLFVTDIITNDSYLIYNSSSKVILESAFKFDDLKEGALLKGVVSRKKQMVPPIMSVLEKL